MADQSINITVRVNAETGQLEVLGQQLQSAGDKAQGTEQSFKGLGKTSNDLTASIVNLITTGAIVKFFSDAVRGAEEESEALRRLKFSLDAVGQSFAQNSEAIVKWASEIQKATRFSDTEAFSAVEKLVRITGNLEQAQKAAALAMDLSVATGRDLASTQELLINLINGNERAIVQAKREFGAFTADAKTTQEVLDILIQKFAGAATNEDSLTKSTAQLTSAFGDFKDQIGGGLSPVLVAIINHLKFVLMWTEKTATGLATIGAVAVSNFQAVYEAAKKIATLDFSGALKGLKENKELEFILEEAARKLEEIEKRYTGTVEQEATKRGDIRARKSEQEVEAERNTLEDRKKAIEKFLADLEKLEDADVKEQIEEFEKAEKKKQAIAKMTAGLIASEFSRAIIDTTMRGKDFGQVMESVFLRIQEQITQTILQTIVLKAILGGSGGNPVGIVAGGFGEGFAAPSFGGSGGGVRAAPSAPGASAAPVYVSVNLSTNNLSLDNAEVIMKALAKQVGRETATAIQFSRRVRDLADKNSTLAV